MKRVKSLHGRWTKLWKYPPMNSRRYRLKHPRYGTIRYRVKQWLKAHRPITQARHDRELAEQRRIAETYYRGEEQKAKAQIDALLPRIASGLIEFDREQQSYVLTTFLGDGIVRSLGHGYPGDRDVAWEYIGERLGHEVTRQLKTLDFGAIMRGPRVIIGDHFIDPWRLRPPMR